MVLAVYGRKFGENSIEMVNILIDELEKRDSELLIFEPFHRFLEKNLGRTIVAGTYSDGSEVGSDISALITIGGDGTILDTITSLGDSGIPVLGMNTGRLGFLANNSKEDVVKAIDCLFKGDYRIDKRSVLQVTTNEPILGENNFALNELTIHKKDSSSMLTVKAYVNDDFLNAYWADGLIIATPTGSTAYSLSCGGPIMAPSSNNFVITPIAPHNLNVRPIILNDSNVITLKVGGRENEYLATLDSRSVTITNNTEITVRRAPFSIHLIQFEWQTFFDTIRNKLLWGLDRRN